MDRSNLKITNPIKIQPRSMEPYVFLFFKMKSIVIDDNLVYGNIIKTLKKFIAKLAG